MKPSRSAAKVSEFVHLAWKGEPIRINQNWRINDCPEAIGHLVWNWHVRPESKNHLKESSSLRDPVGFKKEFQTFPLAKPINVKSFIRLTGLW